MSKPNGSARKAPTHFETVPLEVVKEIAVVDVSTNQKIGGTSPSVERPAKKLTTPVPARPPEE